MTNKIILYFATLLRENGSVFVGLQPEHLNVEKDSTQHSFGHILRRNCHLKHVNIRKIKYKRRRESRCKQLLDDLKEKRRYCNLKEEALDSTLWRTRFGRSYEPVAKQVTE